MQTFAKSLSHAGPGLGVLMVPHTLEKFYSARQAREQTVAGPGDNQETRGCGSQQGECTRSAVGPGGGEMQTCR